MSTENEGAYGFDVERIDNPNENDFVLLVLRKLRLPRQEVEKGWHNGSDKLTLSQPIHSSRWTVAGRAR